MAYMGPILNAIKESDNEEERDVLLHLLVGINKGWNYPRCYLESEFAKNSLSPNGFAAFKEVMHAAEKLNPVVESAKQPAFGKGKASGTAGDLGTDRVILCALTDCPLLLSVHKREKKFKMPTRVQKPIRRRLRPRPALLSRIEEEESGSEVEEVKVKKEDESPVEIGGVACPVESDSSFEMWVEVSPEPPTPNAPIVVDW